MKASERKPNLENMNGSRIPISVRVYPFISAMLEAEATANKISLGQVIEHFCLQCATSDEAQSILLKYASTNAIVMAVVKAKEKSSEHKK